MHVHYVYTHTYISFSLFLSHTLFCIFSGKNTDVRVTSAEIICKCQIPNSFLSSTLGLSEKQFQAYIKPKRRNWNYMLQTKMEGDKKREMGGDQQKQNSETVAFPFSQRHLEPRTWKLHCSPSITQSHSFKSDLRKKCIISVCIAVQLSSPRFSIF